ncbi:zinc-finger-containing protein [Moniliophthora roreri MCA 2997]|uniref:Zinc-finger-containing protein n=1 Tax=Moniliophthora roreri (strain MCA 2997) TaxID=1381753 RepID=V2XJ29_MONRO|nr:zinc-finger-containing protein [Moniliophthora roreri MCA 2997]
MSLMKSRSSSSSQWEPCYCSLCDQYFLTKAMLQQHLETSRIHPRCETCDRSFLNKNSLRNHFVLSNRHHYCRECDQTFQSASGLRAHLEHHPAHSDDLDEDDDLFELDPIKYPPGWEDALGEEEDRRANKEDPIITDDSEPAMSRVEVMKTILAMKQRMTRPAKKLVQSCPICLSTPKSMSAARCGHLFCTSCISHAFETSGSCPSCRRPGLASQLRKVKLNAS